MAPIKLHCRAELLQQWADDVAKNPQAFATLMSMSPEFVAALVHDATAAAWLHALVNGPRTDAASGVIRAHEPSDSELLEVAREEAVIYGEGVTMLDPDTMLRVLRAVTRKFPAGVATV